MRIGFEQTLYSVAESAGVLEISVRVLADENGNIPSIGLPLGVRVTSIGKTWNASIFEIEKPAGGGARMMQ